MDKARVRATFNRGTPEEVIVEMPVSHDTPRTIGHRWVGSSILLSKEDPTFHLEVLDPPWPTANVIQVLAGSHYAEPNYSVDPIKGYYVKDKYGDYVGPVYALRKGEDTITQYRVVE